MSLGVEQLALPGTGLGRAGAGEQEFGSGYVHLLDTPGRC